MTAMACSRVTPAFTVMMTITPVVAGEMACAWATAGRAMVAAPIGARASARTMVRIAFIGLVSPVTAVTVGARHRRRSDLRSQMYGRFPRTAIRDNVDGL